MARGGEAGAGAREAGATPGPAWPEGWEKADWGWKARAGAKVVQKALRRCADHPRASLFRRPPTDEDLARYREKVKHPVDLTMVRRKVEGKRPPSLLELEWLLMVMVTNALVHAAPDTAEYEAAREFKAHIKQVFAQARGECKHLLVGERPLAAKRKKKAEDEGGAGPSGRGRKAKKETERSSPGDGRAGGGGGKAEKAAPSKARGGAKKPAAKGGDGPKKERKKPAGGKGKKATSASPNENDGPQAKKKGGRAAKAEAKVEPLHMNGANGNGVEHGDGYGMTCIALKKRWLQQSMASFKRNGEDFAS